MEEPTPRQSRIVLASGLAAAIVVGAAGFLLGRATMERSQGSVPTPPVAPSADPATPKTSRTLARSDLIALAAAAADATAGGRQRGGDLAQAAGQRFELRLPFGCNGPDADDGGASMRWRYDPKTQALRIHVDPVVWTAADWVDDTASAIEAIEGFWIARPWTASETCPAGGYSASAVGIEPVTLPGQTLAVGQLFFAEGGRSGRRDAAPYEAVIRTAKNELNLVQGLRLKVSGRVARTPGVGPVLCRQPAGPAQQPICLINVVMDEVAVENPANGQTLATWSVAGSDTPAR